MEESFKALQKDKIMMTMQIDKLNKTIMNLQSQIQGLTEENICQ